MQLSVKTSRVIFLLMVTGALTTLCILSRWKIGSKKTYLKKTFKTSKVHISGFYLLSIYNANQI